MGISFDKGKEDIRKRRKQTLLEHIDRDIQDEQEAITNYYGLRGLCETLRVNSDVKQIANEIVKDEERHLDMLIKLRRRVWLR